MAAQPDKPPGPTATASLGIAQPIAEIPTARDAELEVISTESEATILVNQSVISRNGRAKIRLPPGLYTVSIARDGYRGAESAVVLMAGDRQSVTGQIQPLEAHGWRKFGIYALVFGAIAEGVAIFAHGEANKRFTGSNDFNTISGVEKGTQGFAIAMGIAGIAAITYDIIKNRHRVEAGPPTLLHPTQMGTAQDGAVP